jgi:hypothetical protein
MLGTIWIIPSADLSTAPSGIGVSDPVAGALGCLVDGEGDDGDAEGELEDGVSRKSSYTRSWCGCSPPVIVVNEEFL